MSDYCEHQWKDEYVIDRLRELLAAFNARYRCECKHNRCKRCELNRQADELLGGDQ